jgi:7,8-dihydropterin-6-yl-methyl-4-(beta-D-ribofuranosyl)aminobenzene 5'-phosphate synthase
VEGFGSTVLFDTGSAGDILLHNMDAMDVAAEQIDAIVLSHDHWDHTGGVPALLERNAELAVYLPASFGPEVKDAVVRSDATLIETQEPEGICPGMTTTGVLGSVIAEQGLCVDAPEGTLLITGCAHPGIVEMVTAARELSDGGVWGVLGGFHLKDDWNTSINRIVAALQDLGVTSVGPCHCSGDAARRKMASVYGENYLDVCLGTRLDFG